MDARLRSRIVAAASKILRDHDAAEDVAQDIACELFRRGLAEPPPGMVTHRCVDRIRRRQRESARDAEAAHVRGTIVFDVEGPSDAAGDFRTELLGRLSDPTQRAAVAAYLDRQTDGQAAEAQGVTRSAITKRRNRAILTLRRSFAAAG